MQKVEGSSPFIRFKDAAGNGGSFWSFVGRGRDGGRFCHEIADAPAPTDLGEPLRRVNPGCADSVGLVGWD